MLLKLGIFLKLKVKFLFELKQDFMNIIQSHWLKLPEIPIFLLNNSPLHLFGS